MLHAEELVKLLSFAPVCEAMPYDVKGDEQLNSDVGEPPFSLSVLTQIICHVRGKLVCWFVCRVVFTSATKGHKLVQ